MKRWKKEDIEIIKSLRLQRHNFYYIANYFDVTVNAVRKALRRHNICYIKNNINYKLETQKYIVIDNKNTFQNIIQINKERIKQRLPILQAL